VMPFCGACYRAHANQTIIMQLQTLHCVLLIKIDRVHRQKHYKHYSILPLVRHGGFQRVCRHR
jgi:hypothetical protein